MTSNGHYELSFKIHAFLESNTKKIESSKTHTVSDEDVAQRLYVLAGNMRILAGIP